MDKKYGTIKYDLYYIKDLIGDLHSIPITEEEVELVNNFTKILTRTKKKIDADILDRELGRLTRDLREAVSPDEIKRIAYEIAKLEV